MKAILAVLAGALLVWAVAHACQPDPTPRPDPTQSVRDSAARVHAADSVRWAVERQGLARTVATLGRERDSLRNLRNAKPVRVVYVPVPDSGTENNPSSDAGLSDSTPMVHLSDYQSLERELAIADTVIETQAAIIRADSLAYARLGALRAFEDSTHKADYSKLEADLARARRGPRFLGLIPLPSRTTTFVLGAVVGVVATRALK